MVRPPYDLAVSNYFYSLDCARRPGCLQREKNMLLPAGKVGLGKLASCSEMQSLHKKVTLAVRLTGMSSLKTRLGGTAQGGRRGCRQRQMEADGGRWRQTETEEAVASSILPRFLPACGVDVPCACRPRASAVAGVSTCLVPKESPEWKWSASLMSSALAIPVLLLACAPAFGQEKQRREFTFVAGHKTGFGFSQSVSACLLPRESPEWWWRPEQEWLTVTGPTDQDQCLGVLPSELGRIVFMVRHPYDMVTSDYFYSLACENRPGCLQREVKLLWAARDSIGQLASYGLRYGEEPKPNETFNAYIHRVGMVDAIMAVMETDGVALVLRQIAVALIDPGRVLTVCLGDLFRAFNKTVRSILRHIGIAADEGMWDCLAALDPSKRKFYHGTHNVDMGLRMEATRTIREIDAKHFGGLFGGSMFAERCKEERQRG